MVVSWFGLVMVVGFWVVDLGCCVKGCCCGMGLVVLIWWLFGACLSMFGLWLVMVVLAVV